MRSGWILMTLGAASVFAACSGEKAECSRDEDCPPGRYCRVSTGECAYDCTHDGECPQGYLCTHRGRCEAGCRPTNGGVEACDGVDNDCDGLTDVMDPRPCQRDNPYGSCQGTERCLDGVWVCDAPEAAPEECDGLDNDCDQQTDEDMEMEACLLQQGVCTGAVRVCQGAAGWSTCDYGADYEPGDEISCDALDNDCDGATDEGVEPLPGCEIGAEAGDGVDNNCNGLVDEPGGCMLVVPFYEDVYIDVYEATVFERADCTGTRYGEITSDYPPGWPRGPDSGTVTLYACSLPGLRPSRTVTWHQARRACRAQGKRLCSKAEWAMACTDTNHWDYPYGNQYLPAACNTFSAGVGDTVPTGSMENCVSQIGVYDMSGNLWEWVEDDCEGDAGRRGVQGGSYYCADCDQYGNCEVCDMDNPEHLDTIEFIHQCHSPAYKWYCDDPLVVSFTHGFRCCMDKP